MVALAVAVMFALPAFVNAADPADQESSSDALFKAYTQYYFAMRDLDFSLEMSLRESFLGWLYSGINQEVAARSNEDPSGTLSAISPPELNGFDEASYAYPDSLADAPMRIQAAAWEKYQRSEYNHKYLQARLVKDRLIRSATPAQRDRMFRSDLESTLFAYRDAQYREAILRFDELIDGYGFTDLADVAFYRGESYLAIQLYDQARADYQYVIANSQQPWYKLKALQKLISLSGDRGAYDDVEKYWEQFTAESGEQKDASYWEAAELAGRYLFAGEQWKRAQAIFEMVPKDSPSYFFCALRAADCATAQLELDQAKTRYESLLTEKVGKASLPENLRDEATLKLGYIDYLKGDYDKAYLKLSKVEADGDIGERAEIGSIWSLYRLSAYPQVAERAAKFITDHPQSQYQYEARCLIGFSAEMTGKTGDAIDNYKVVMSALDDRQEFHDYNYELETVTRDVARLKELETAIFSEGESEFFPEYLAIRKELGGLMDGIKLARSMRATPFLKEIIKEQKELLDLFQEQAVLERNIHDSQDTRLHDDFDQVVGELADIGSQLSGGVKYYMNQKSLIQREEDKRFESQMSDTIRKQLDQEWAETQQAQALVRQYMESAEGSDAQTLVDLASVEVTLDGVQDRILRVKADLSKYGQDVVASNLDEWSDFAYQRYAYGGINFDYLYTRENRLGQLDTYISQVNGMLQAREAARRDTLKLAADLALASQPGQTAYYAPAVQLWGLAPVAVADTSAPVTEVAPGDSAAAPVTAPTEASAPAETATPEPSVAPTEPAPVPAPEVTPPAPQQEEPQSAPPDSTGKPPGEPPPAPSGERDSQNGRSVQ